MDPISATIVGALVAGAAAACQEAAGSAVKDAYQGLKNLLLRRMAGVLHGELVLSEHEKNPEVWKKPMEEVLTQTGADKDQEVLRLAETVLKIVAEAKPGGPQVHGSGAIATQGGVAESQTITAGGNVTIYKVTQVTRPVEETCPSVRDYMNDKGPLAYNGMGNPAQPWDLCLDVPVDVNELREMLLNNPGQRERLTQQSKMVTVKGHLYPCALLVSGWWESRMEQIQGAEWQNGVQGWLFNGFHSWGPSWDFTWDFESAKDKASRPSYVAQLGDGDEANSIPVLIPADKADALIAKFRERGRELKMSVSGIPAKVTGLLCHRRRCPDAQRMGLVGGILDFCIWLKPGEEAHTINLSRGKPDVYSGYLWKCVAPKEWAEGGKALELNQVYFLWEHTNLADPDSVKYNLDSLEHKERYISKLHDSADLVLLQKSSPLISGAPVWTKDEFYRFFVGPEVEI